MIHLYTASTPNGHKISCLLEALKMPYEVHSVNLGEGDQHKADFVKISPNCGSCKDNIDDNFHVNYFGVLHKSHFFEDHLDGLIGALPELVWVVFVDGNGTDWLFVHKTFELFFR